MNVKTLILSDLHLNYKIADKIIKCECPDKVVLLGDYFDDFGDTVADNVEMAHWLKNSMSISNRIHLMGNHDIGYAMPHRSYKCSGYTISKEYAINDVIKDWTSLKLFTWVGPWLCSHAGIHNHLYNRDGIGYEFNTWLTNTCDEALKNAFENKPADTILRAGRIRGGIELFGGIIWSDAREFDGISGINQVFGHTPSSRPVWINKGEINNTDIYSQNLALDVSHSKYYALHNTVNTNVLTTHWIGDL